MKKRRRLMVVLAALMLACCLKTPAMSQEKGRDELTGQCMSAMSRIQTYLEFYFMETGRYPAGLMELEKVFNEDVGKNAEKIVFPRDPATGREFVYNVTKDMKGYRLACPDASKYGMERLELSQVSWGWMTMIAEEKRRKAFALFCKYGLDATAASIKKFEETEKKAPQALKDLIPKYLKAAPVCPLTGKEYNYILKGKEYVIACPNPRDHGFSLLEYSSKTGFRAEPLNVQPEVKAPGAPAPQTPSAPSPTPAQKKK